MSQAIASLGVGLVGLGEGKENSRIFGQVNRTSILSGKYSLNFLMNIYRARVCGDI